MKVCAVIAEYDPLHNGHIYHLQQTRKKYDRIVVLMSGHAVQRGELSRYDKWSRAKAALMCGADLVLELPTVCSCTCAERFAEGAVSLLSRLCVVDAVSFGSESGNIEVLTDAAHRSLYIEKDNAFKNLLKKGYNYPVARSLTLGQYSELLKKPNNILGIEYIKAGLKLNSNLKFVTVKRTGVMHNDLNTDGCNRFVSSAFLRENPSEIASFLPHNLIRIFNRPAYTDEKVVLHRLRNMTARDFKELLDVKEGLENRLFCAAQKAVSLTDFKNRVNTKRYTYSRINRIILYSMLNIKKTDVLNPPGYVRVLGFNSQGRQLLKRIKNESDLLVSPNFKAIFKSFKETAKFDVLATNLFSLGYNPPLPCGIDFTTPSVLYP